MAELNPQQKAAVDARGREILVSAPAGSGKTRILVTRILALIESGIPVNRLLVLTFTQAAAAEMKQRLAAQLEEKIHESSGERKTYLQEQKEQLPFCDITNFHGYCHHLLSQYGYLLGIAPGYDILEDTDWLFDMALDLALDEALKSEETKNMRALYFYRREDLKTTLKKLHQVFSSLPDKDAFLDFMDREVYGFFSGDEPLEKWAFYGDIKKLLKEKIEDGLSALESLKRFCEANGIWPFYEKMNDKAIPYEAYKECLESSLIDLQPHEPAPMASIPWKKLGEDAKAEYNRRKALILKPFQDAYQSYIMTNREDLRAMMAESHRALKWLCALEKQVESVYSKLKESRNVLDFNDLEKGAMALLKTPLRDLLTGQYDEIMIDEYQDTNMVQETLIKTIAQDRVPVFMVGDMKQAIYRFRQADPEIFRAKYETFGKNENGVRIDLNVNYRSSKTILAVVNYLFNQLMDTSVGELEYVKDPSAYLRHGNQGIVCDEAAEVLLVNSTDMADEDPLEYEAVMTAQRILELHFEQGYKYADIAVLMRQTAGFMTYKRVFDRYGIPTSIVLSKGLLASVEISQLMSVYRYFADEDDEAALYAILRAPFLFSHFSDQMLIQYRGRLKAALNSEAVFADCKKALDDLKERFYHERFDLWHADFFSVSGYLDLVRGLRNGSQRANNLLLWVDMISQQDFHTFRDWLDYFESLSHDEPATLPRSEPGVVFMTIHKSKGLEFPVVFVANHQHHFNLSDSKDTVIFDKNLTLGIKPRQWLSLPSFIGDEPVTYNVPTVFDSFFMKLLVDLQNRQSISEELRIYYVALTRAKEKLILTGALDEEGMAKYQSQLADIDEDEWLLPRRMRQAKCLLDWLMPCLLRNDNLKSTMKETASADIQFQWLGKEEILAGTKEYVVKKAPKVTKQLFAMADYPYLDEVDSPETRTPTSLADHYFGGTSSHASDAAEIGTLVHDFMEHLDAREVTDIISSSARYDEKEKEILLSYADKITAYQNSSLFQYCLKADTYLKEQPFVYEEDGVLYHGVMDALAIKDQEIVLIDYKTDRVPATSGDDFLADRHRAQLELYKKALRAMFPGYEVHAWLYYLNIQRAVLIA